MPKIADRWVLSCANPFLALFLIHLCCRTSVLICGRWPTELVALHGAYLTCSPFSERALLISFGGLVGSELSCHFDSSVSSRLTWSTDCRGHLEVHPYRWWPLAPDSMPINAISRCSSLRSPNKSKQSGSVATRHDSFGAATSADFSAVWPGGFNLDKFLGCLSIW